MLKNVSKNVKNLITFGVLSTLIAGSAYYYHHTYKSNDYARKASRMSKHIGYDFDENGVLKNIKTGEKFKYINQRHYDEVGEFVIYYIYDKLLSKYNFKEVHLPDKEKVKVNIFVPKEKKSDTLLVLIQGSGYVRPGQWARKLCINDSLQTGSMFPYIERAQQLGYDVIILNPNQVAPQNESPEAHVQYVWDNIIHPSDYKKIAIVAHSYGGIATVYLLHSRGEQVLERVKAIAFTDSVHGRIGTRHLSPKIREYFRENAINWAISNLNLNTRMRWREAMDGCTSLSAGTEVHEMTNAAAMNSIFDYIQHKLQ